MSDFIWRPVKLPDAAEIVSMFELEKRRDPRLNVLDQATTEHTLERVQSSQHGAGAVVLNHLNQIIGIAIVMLLPADREITAQCIGHVHIDYRRQGLGKKLLDWIKLNAQEMYTQANLDFPLRLRTSCRDFMVDRIALFESQGLAPVRYSIEMRCELDSATLDYQLPSDIQVKQWSEPQDDQLRQAFNLAFREHWGTREMEPEDWRQWVVGGPHFRPDLTYLAYVDEKLIGFCITECHVTSNKETGRNQAWMEVIGVHPDWRGQGIASGLMAYAIKSYRAQSFTHAGLDVDAENATNAIALYQKLGFEEVRREIIYGKRIS